MKVQLLYFAGCPHVAEARDVLRRALRTAGVPDEFEDLDVSVAGVPDSLLDWGSPTILINGVDVAGMTRGDGPGCRLYAEAATASRGSPNEAAVVAALQRAESNGEGMRS